MHYKIVVAIIRNIIYFPCNMHARTHSTTSSPAKRSETHLPTLHITTIEKKFGKWIKNEHEPLEREAR